MAVSLSAIRAIFCASLRSCTILHAVELALLSAATEPKSIDSVAGLVVAANEFVTFDDVVPQAVPEHAADDGQWLEARSANSVCIKSDLVRLAQIDRFKCPPHIGAPNFGGGVAGAV